MEDKCIWIMDSDGTYETACNETWYFVDGNLSEHRVKFCPFCGKLIKEEFNEDTK